MFPAEEGGLLRASNWRHRTLAPAVERVVERTDKARTEEAAEATDGHPSTPEFPTITTHDLRHTAASLAISAGASVLGVQRMLGHAKASMTLDVYSDLFDTDLEAVAEYLDKLRGGHRLDTKGNEAVGNTGEPGAVSYTHLTLPTIYSV